MAFLPSMADLLTQKIITAITATVNVSMVNKFD